MRRHLLLAAAGCAAVVTVLAVLVSQQAPVLLRLDVAVTGALHVQDDGGYPVPLLEVLTAPGLTVFRLVVLVPVALLFAIRRQWRTTWFILVAALLVSPLTTLLKELVGRIRPTAEEPLVAAKGLSFPSGHASGSATLAGVLLVVLWPAVRRQWRPVLAVAAALLAMTVAWTRMALGVHYLSDVIGGLFLGATVVLLSMALVGLDRGGPRPRGERKPERGP